jgi:hypothetical protein
VPYFGTFLPNAVTLKSIENYVRKNCSVLVPKVLMKLTPGMLAHCMGALIQWPLLPACLPACTATLVSITIVNFIIILAPWPYFAHLETFIQIYVFKACLEILQSVAKGHTEGLLV